MKTKRKRKPIQKLPGIPVVRLVNPDGQMNIVKLGLRHKGSLDVFHSLLQKSWFGLTSSVIAFIFFSNLLFAVIYYYLGNVIDKH